MALLSNYYVDGDSGSDSTGDGTSGSPFATNQKAIDEIATESSNDLVTAASGVVTVHWVAGNVGSNDTLSGITDDASNYIEIIGLIHTTKLQWDTGGTILDSTGGSNGINNSLNYTRFTKLQIAVSDDEYNTGINNTGTTVIIDSCIIKGPDDGSVSNLAGISNGHTSGTVYCRKCVVYGLESTTGYNRSFQNNAAGTTECQNCGAYGDEGTTGYIYGFLSNSGAINCTNCYAKADAAYGAADTVTTSAAQDTSGEPAALDSIPLNTSYFVDPNNATSTSRDFSLVDATVLSDGTEATDISGTFTTDWLGNTISTWPIGPIEYVAAGTTVNASYDPLTLTEYTSIVNAETNISANIDALSLTAYTAAISTTADVNVNANLVSLSLTEYAASINAEINVTVALTSLTLTTYGASVSIGTVINASYAPLSLVVYAASINAENNIAASLVTLTLTEYATTISLAAGPTIDGVVADVITTNYGEGSYYSIGGGTYYKF